MRKTPLRPGPPPRRKTRVRQRSAKRPAELERIYGPATRRAWIKAMTCCWCGLWGHTDQAHTVTGGKGRKADASGIAPLCDEFGNGCHAKYDQHKPPFDESANREAVKAYAVTLDAQWQAVSGALAGTTKRRTA